MDAGRLKLFDVHCHLQDRRIFASLQQIIEASLACGLQHLGCNGCCEDDWDQVHNIATEHPAVIPNFGLHPWWVPRRSASWLDNLKKKLLEVPSAGLGECGLDRSARAPADSFEDQCLVFHQQLQLANELQRPVSVHCVKAFPELKRHLEQEQPFGAGVILHSWAGPAAMVKPLAAIPGVHFSISGHSLRSEKKAGPMLKEIPLDRLLLETDSPDGLLPQRADAHHPLSDASPDQRLNHPANIRLVLQVVAELREEDPAKVASAAYDNAMRLFSSASDA
ncbi:hypothetical protein WJX73_010258 [Symbiochloris irregularis]|uniref:Uncharacterized protein n=1 Tax=Symbiochloris irregularis TaxID=706552 RepID=A0AAW1PZZ4_9CHLO